MRGISRAEFDPALAEQQQSQVLCSLEQRIIALA
jgi:hypothetical protein